MTNDTRARIVARIDSFIADLTTMTRAAALEAVQSALGESAAPARRGPGRPRGSGKKAASKATKPPRLARRAKGARRSTANVEATTAKFVAFVKANDGKRLEEISKGLGIRSHDLKLPAQKLLAAKAVKTTGQKRGTKYHVAAGAKA